MSEDKLDSKLDSKVEQVEGAAKEVVGKVTGDHKLKTEGSIEKFSGKVKEMVNNIEETAEEITAKVKEAISRDKDHDHEDK